MIGRHDVEIKGKVIDRHDDVEMIGRDDVEMIRQT